MAAFTVSTGGIVKWDSQSGGSVIASLDTYSISARSTLLIETDSYQCAGHSLAFGSLDTVSFSGTGGKLKIDGNNVRVIPFSTGSGTVPAIGTTIGQAGGVSGYLLGVWANWQSEPLAAAAAMPATGFIKIKDKVGNFSAAGLTGITATATGIDVPGWIEVRGADTAQITVPRIGEFEVTGTWFELGTTNGARGQVLACPTTATVAGVFPGVQIETAVGSGIYEWYRSVGTLAAATTIPTDSTRGKIIWQTTAGIRIGSDGTNNVGFLPVTGLRVRIPNVILTCCTRTAAGSGIRVLPNATLTTRQEYVTTSAGAISIDKAVHQWYGLWLQPYSCTLTNSAFNDVINIAEQATGLNVVGNLVAPTQLQLTNALTLTSCFAGGSVTDNIFCRGSIATSGVYVNLLADCSGIAFARNITQSFANRGNASVGTWNISRLANCTWTDEILIGGRIVHTTSTKPIHTNTKYVDRFVGTTDLTFPMDAICFQSGTTGGVVEGFLLPETNLHPYNALVQVANSYKTVIKNIGTYAAPLTGGSASQTGHLVTSGSGSNSNVRVKRCYVFNTRTGLHTFSNSDSDVIFENCATDYSDVIAIAANNSAMRSCGFTFDFGGQTSCYGTHFGDSFTSATAGRIVALMNEPTALTSAQCFVSGGTPRFNSVGAVLLTVVGDQITMEMPYYVKGHTATVNAAPTLTGTNTGNMSYEFQYQRSGEAYNGTWLTLNAANWFAIGAITSTGIKIKLRITCTVASATNLLTQVRLDTVTTASAQPTDLWPISTNTLTITGLQVGSDIVILDAGTTTILASSQENATSSFVYTYSEADVIDIGIFIAGYIPKYIRNLSIGTTADSTLPVAQAVDRGYLV